MAVTNHARGHAAEHEAARFLSRHSFHILDLNWRTRYCEIDIIARRGRVIYMVEVKSRMNSSYGRGLEYVTEAKMRQMRFAAELWISCHNWKGDYSLAAIEVDGKTMAVTDLVLDV